MHKQLTHQRHLLNHLRHIALVPIVVLVMLFIMLLLIVVLLIVLFFALLLLFLLVIMFLLLVIIMLVLVVIVMFVVIVFVIHNTHGRQSEEICLLNVVFKQYAAFLLMGNTVVLELFKKYEH